jgi:hypothetical protein
VFRGSLAILVVMLAAGTSTASAATEVGSNCAGDSPVGYTLVQLTKGTSNALPIATPTAGVVTKWKVNSAHSRSFSEKLKVLRPTEDPHTFQSVAESSVGTVSTGQNAFDTRISVRAGDRFGVKGVPPSGALFCTSDPDPANVLGAHADDIPVGSTGSFFEFEELQAAVSAIIEPDGDGDGYGDETQDLCPQSAALQTSCPIATVSSSPIVKRRHILLLVNVSSPAMATVYGQAKWSFRSPPKRQARQSKTRKLTARLDGGTQTLQPDRVGRFKLALPKAVLRGLNQITPRESIGVKLTVRAIDPIQRMTWDINELKLHGRKRQPRSGAVATPPE